MSIHYKRLSGGLLLLIMLAGIHVEPSMAQEEVAFFRAAPVNEEKPAVDDADAQEEAVCELIRTEYPGEITITTGNCVANIYVRFLSLGPGGCAVEAREDPSYAAFEPAIVGYFVLPGVWSDWLVFKGHIGGITTRIVNHVHCDTGVRSQVKYYK